MKLPKLSRNQWVLLVLVLVLTGEVVNYIWSNWGLVTIHAKGQSLSQVIRSIEKQGHVTIQSNLDATKPVDMWVTKVSLAEAMETLSVVTESRWRLAYYVAPDKGAIATAKASFASGQKKEGWHMMVVPLPPIGDEPAVLPDPRKDTWVVKTPAEATLQAYLKEAAKNVSATFYVPEGFNPPVKAPPKSGEISSALPKLVSAAKGKYEEVFLLQGSNRNADRGERGEGDRRDRGGDDGEPRFAGNFGGGDRPKGGFDRSAMEERIQNEINKLPASERTAAQQEHDARKQFFDSLKDMTPEQKAAAFQQMASDPAMQAKMEDASNNRDSRRTPAQRIARAQSYLQRMAAATGK
ncbi:MAG: hypothetical protein ABJF10_27945 [Chthoniobacter sp.]|uniref:hypothetical protein n=1 Tax=Chthoniobacter sp. TaxID=2510640 RepID=UPI0032A98D95